jgi:hypothetical protein
MFTAVIFKPVAAMMMMMMMSMPMVMRRGL